MTSHLLTSPALAAHTAEQLDRELLARAWERGAAQLAALEKQRATLQAKQARRMAELRQRHERANADPARNAALFAKEDEA